jgi:calcium/calmodulin-dependent protein kinase I
MASIFIEKPDPKFWQKLNNWPRQSCSLPIHSGTLKSSTTLPEAVNFELFPFQLCTNDVKIPKQFVDLRFRSLQPFVETFQGSEIFGFKIDSEDFFVESEKELKNWLKVLRPMCILSNIEDDYVMIQSIGTGSTASVYLSEEIHSKKQVAIKCVNKEKIQKYSDGLNKLCNEIAILQDLTHDRICQIFAVYESEDTVYLVMEYLPEGTLCKKLMKQGKFQESTARLFMKSFLETLDYLHCKNIVHRDLKLENIMVVAGDEIKIIDFGLAFNCSSVQSNKCGSPGYVAPEIMLSDCYDSKIDIFSAGVILYLMLVGKHPFEGRNERKILENNILVNYKMPKGVSQEAVEIVKMMLQPDPELRPSAAELLMSSWISCEKESPCFLATAVAL